MQQTYRKILLAIDLHPACDLRIAKRALGIAHETHAQLTVIHAVEHINAYGVAQAYPAVIDLEHEMVVEAQKQLEELANKLGVRFSEQEVQIGSPKTVILNKAEEINCDLIVVGSHGRHGLSRLFGSTATAIIHNAPCDVLVIKVKENNQ
jgi:universal stress protein A